MLRSYLTLDLPQDASNSEIRNRYLELVKKYSPEKNPDRFRRITQAYEEIKDLRSRVSSRLFLNSKVPDYKEALSSIVHAKEPDKKVVGLNELLKAVKDI